MNNIIINGVSTSIPLYTNSWKELNIMEELDIPAQKPDIKKLLSVNTESTVTSFEIVRTPVTNANEEGSRNTGYKAIIKGILSQIIEYIEDTCEQQTHSTHYRVPFYSYIVLDNYTPGNSVEVNSLVEDVYVKQLDKRRFFKNVTVFVYAEIREGSQSCIIPSILLKEGNGVYINGETPYYIAYVHVHDLPTFITISSIPQSHVSLISHPGGYSLEETKLIISPDALNGPVVLDVDTQRCFQQITIEVALHAH